MSLSQNPVSFAPSSWLIAFCIGLIVYIQLPAQQGYILDWDIDTIFDEPLSESPIEETRPGTAAAVTVQKLIKQRGYNFSAAYTFTTGAFTGWFETPWSSDWDRRDYYLEYVIKMRGAFSIDAQISDAFRAYSSISFDIPNFAFTLGNFFFDYNFFDKVFFRGGKYDYNWGISPNFTFANLLARVPIDGYSGDSYIFKADIPVGIGGFQALAMTRANLLQGVIPKTGDFGFGGKFNFAYRWMDLDLGVFYQEDMPLRGSLSFKATYKKAVWYAEWIYVNDIKEWSDRSFATNFGLTLDLFGGRFLINGEVFLNTEGNAYWIRPETWLQDTEISPFIEGLNGALNLNYRLWEKGNPRLFVQALYAMENNSIRLIPGFRLTPLPNINLYLATPMALGGKDGYYHKNTVYVDSKGKPLPFSIVLLVTLSGSVNFGHYY